MKVSIITVVLNAAETVEDCIKSVCTQTHSDIEHIIIDGGSTDGTLDIINRYRNNITKVISEPDNGLYHAMNKGIGFAEGEIIGFLNADDVYADENVISEVVNVMQEGCFDAVYGDLVYIDCLDSDKVVRYWQPGEYKKGAFLHGWVPPHPTFFCRKQVYEKFGCFNDKFQFAADFELMLRFIERYKIKVAYLPKVIVKMRTGGKTTELRGVIRGNREVVECFRLNGFSLSPWFFVQKLIERIKQVFKRSEIP